MLEVQTLVTKWNLKAKDIDGLKKWLENQENREEAEYITVDECGLVSVNWNYRKIIPYWHPDFLFFLKKFARYVDGDVCLVTDTGQHSAIIRFLNGKCFIDICSISFRTFPIEELLIGYENSGDDK